MSRTARLTPPTLKTMLYSTFQTTSRCLARLTLRLKTRCACRTWQRGSRSDTFAPSRALEIVKLSRILYDSSCATVRNPGHQPLPTPYYDWALIDMLRHEPNRIGPRQSFNLHDLVAAAPGDTGNGQPVLVMTGSRVVQRASLPTLSSRVLPGPGDVFTNALCSTSTTVCSSCLYNHGLEAPSRGGRCTWHRRRRPVS